MAVTYETFFVLDPTLNDDAVGKVIEKIAGFIKEKEGEVLKQENWGKHKLTAAIRKKNEGIYLYFNYTAPPIIVDELRKFLKYEEAVMRSITTKQEFVRKSRFTKKQKAEVSSSEMSESNAPVTEAGADATT